MLKLTKRLGEIPVTKAEDSVTLPFELRKRGRLKARSDKGAELGIFLDRGPVLRDGDGVRAENGEVIRIRAAAEPVVSARIEGSQALARLCYHLGNRHVSLAIGTDEQGAWVRFPPDHVLEALAVRLGAALEYHEAPFNPEPGAYSQGEGHATAHRDGHSHGLASRHEHTNDH